MIIHVLLIRIMCVKNSSKREREREILILLAYLRERSEDDVFCPEERPEVCVKKPPLYPGSGVRCGPQLDGVCGDLQKEKSTGKPSNHTQAHAYH